MFDKECIKKINCNKIWIKMAYIIMFNHKIIT